MTTSQDWKIISIPTKRFSATIKVDGATFEDITFATSLKEAKEQITHCWTLLGYESKGFEIIDIKETKK